MNKDSTERPKSHLKAIVVLGIISALTPFSIDMYLPALPEMTISFGTSTFFTQLTLTIFMLGLAIGQLIAGPISDAIGERGQPPQQSGLIDHGDDLCDGGLEAWIGRIKFSVRNQDNARDGFHLVGFHVDQASVEIGLGMRRERYLA